LSLFKAVSYLFDVANKLTHTATHTKEQDMKKDEQREEDDGDGEDGGVLHVLSLWAAEMRGVMA
jgi:hypothetical protein